MVDTNTKDFIKMTIRRFLPDPEYKIFIFGSRITGYARKFSDYDVGIQGPRPVGVMTMADITEAFGRSYFPYVVDLVDFSKAADSFAQFARKHVQYLV